jgi:tRNA(fMet)-specific endonuclease VapC
MMILDSDIFTHLTYGHANVVRNYEAVRDREQLAVTAVTRIEVLRGRTDSLLKAANAQELLVATKRLQATEAALTDFLVLHVDEQAARHFQVVGQQRCQVPDFLGV